MMADETTPSVEGTPAQQGMPPALPGGPVPPPQRSAATEEQRRATLATYLSQQIRKGWRVESQTDYNAAIAKGKRPNHILHLILTIITGGLWGLFVWLPLSLFKHEHRRLLTVDAYGEVTG